MRKTEPKTIPRDQHTVSRRFINENALKVLHRLNNSGYNAYLVGGGVRDILLGKQPKDFDVATDASPEEVHALFRNSRLIGRRFRLVHILFGRDMIEVATFRGSADESSDDKSGKHQTEHGMLLRDNVYGTLEEDAERRDFTVNALYYCPRDFTIYDHLGGMEDIAAKRLHLIGDPEVRYREDPVRMLRAVRFAAKLQFTIDPDTADPIYELAGLLENVAPARLFDEVIKLFLSGNGREVLSLLRDFGLFQALFPKVAKNLESSERSDFYYDFIGACLDNTDARIKQDKPINPAFLYATMLWPEVDRRWQTLQADGMAAFPALQEACHMAIQDQLPHIMIPKRFILMIREIWELQMRLTRNKGRRARELLSHPRFRAGYDFLLLREKAGEDHQGLGQWWTEFQEKHPVPTRGAKPQKSKSRAPRRNRRQRKPV